MTRNELNNIYWSKYLDFEKRFIKSFHFIALSPNNENATSEEYSELIQIIGSELDSFFKIFCGYNLDDRKNISDYAKKAFEIFPGITGQEIKIKKAEETLVPFHKWNIEKASESLFWWKAFTNIKHKGDKEGADATQKNVLYILAALFLLERKYFSIITEGTREPDVPDEESDLFWPLGNEQFIAQGNGFFAELIQ